ncbi:peptidoglycan endopeptidase [Sphingomonas sp. BGYR3]|uniref:peptidoglycan endopeptidase n=1 Tax=Sphingomonas sp. BGYR3 TaxID=2975483 RepID=UPI0021A3008F|nr:peptidoglycan endopeptidase [Sphingomonas sp. BGYR3]MDG5489135.1 peptidoglycan endopeptidase [Sphingomonas sp. BGYR3]
MEEVLGRARALIGVRFRLHGRDPATGLDCVGLVALAIARPDVGPRGYALRMDDPMRAAGWAAAADLMAGTGAAGEIVLLRPAAGQLHLGIANGSGGIVHADAGLGRVVERPGPLPWPVLARWRIKGEG